MGTLITGDICILGGGSGGLSVAAGASQMGAKTILIEGGKMGGDCLNYGCVPSKSLIAAAKKAHGYHDAADFGISAAAPEVDYGRVMDHVEDVIAGIAPHDSVERFEGLGVTVLKGYGRFVGRGEVQVGETTVRARRFVIATGSRPAIPPVPGLEETPYLTNETLFSNRIRPDHLIVIGGGPIGMELAAAHVRLGCKVTVLEAFTALSREDPELRQVVLDCLREEGADIREGAEIVRVAPKGGNQIEVVLNGPAGEETLAGSHLLVATGRTTNIEDLDLQAAGVETTRTGVVVDARLRTTNRKIFAIGDVAGPYQFTHAASYHAGIVLRNALFRLPAKVDYAAFPRVTFTDPEIASVGMDEDAARKAFGADITVLRFPYAENDRARADRKTTGLVKVITSRKGRILGAGIVGYQAGELIQLWGLAISKGLKIGAVASLIAPYPTYGEINKRAAGAFYTPKLFSKGTARLVRFLGLFG
ncbi:dihydrolipoyl dehydrogenase family protein [Sneathiella chinensis]|uniref:Dihydrolipoamide dehydrogenase n=1 Tax=Sneathiella chinensis TaxID=349750 RepID=A0ABQ5U2G3_9PROT|nr:FAD-dependent oxidoreductase [Sneathiella chinensis]GLQ05454.1 dihydrolipoamide dehydrogenase [Sneathiella chinensis]